MLEAQAFVSSIKFYRVGGQSVFEISVIGVDCNLRIYFIKKICRLLFAIFLPVFIKLRSFQKFTYFFIFARIRFSRREI